MYKTVSFPLYNLSLSIVLWCFFLNKQNKSYLNRMVSHNFKVIRFTVWERVNVSDPSIPFSFSENFSHSPHLYMSRAKVLKEKVKITNGAQSEVMYVCGINLLLHIYEKHTRHIFNDYFNCTWQWKQSLNHDFIQSRPNRI